MDLWESQRGQSVRSQRDSESSLVGTTANTSSINREPKSSELTGSLVTVKHESIRVFSGRTDRAHVVTFGSG